MNILVGHHNKDPEVCQWVIDAYKDNERYTENSTVQEWVRQSEEALNAERTE